MSILDFKGFISLDPTVPEDKMFIMDSSRCNILLTINIISILGFIFFYTLYSIDEKLRRPPSKFKF